MESAVALGFNAGNSNQGFKAIALGDDAGRLDQGDFAIAIGHNAGQTGQKMDSIAIGFNAGGDSQGTGSIAIGPNAGSSNLGENSIAIGSLIEATGSNTIVLNTNVFGLNTSGSSGFYVDPINQNSTGDTGNVLTYDTVNKSIVYNSAKTFIIDHPQDANKYLIHGCLEGPENGVYYRGKATISNDESVSITLPSYVQELASDFTIQITPVGSQKRALDYSVFRSGK